MSRKAKSAGVDPAVAAITIPAALLDALVKGPMTAAEVQAASMAFKKAGNSASRWRRRSARSIPRPRPTPRRESVGHQYPTIVASWERAWPYVTPFFVFPPAVRKLISTTNAIESLHMRLRKIIKTRGHFPTDEAASKLLWLAIRNATKTTVRSAHAWHEAMNQFAIFFGERFTHPQR